MARLIERRTTLGRPVLVGNVRATPEARALIVRLPFAAFVWHRPTAVVIERNGRVERRPIVNVTRIAQVALWSSVLAVFLAWRWWPKR
jgi:hypothetical protein